MDHASLIERFADGLATEAGVDRAALDRPGTTVVGNPNRAGSGALACYHIGAHLVVWADPELVDQAASIGLVDATGPARSGAELDRLVGSAGFEKVATVVSNLLDGPATPAGELDRSVVDYRHQWLPSDGSEVVDRVRAFTERCDPDEVEAAALDELDEFDEAAINVVVDPEPRPGEPEPIVAYASASGWDWDAALADIGVLVDAAHRRRGLANFVVANTVARLLDEGRIPLYRHEAQNAGSAAVAASIGFRPVATLDYYVRQQPES